jgi:myo-inositol-1(or 4)-monophosphatase
MTIAAEIEHTAVRLARMAGEHITAALGKPLQVDFKSAAAGSAVNSNPVSEVDRAVETLLRRELATAFPDHAIIGEESMGPMRVGAEFTWVIDPVDGTTNFINGLPLFGTSIGVLRDGHPIAGAIWCSTSHALRPGVYHAREGGTLRFDDKDVVRRDAGAWRGIASLPRHVRSYGAHWDSRLLGSATLEIAFAAAGLLRLAYVPRPSLWDAAAGVVLANAAGCVTLTLQDSKWIPLKYFEPLESWRQPILVGDKQAVDLAAAAGA